MGANSKDSEHGEIPALNIQSMGSKNRCRTTGYGTCFGPDAFTQKARCLSKEHAKCEAQTA